MEQEQRQAAKRSLVAAMERGLSWQEAREAAGLHVSRATVYRWYHQARQGDETVWQDGRHGYLMRHKTILYDGIRADAYFNDPYVWFSPYLWSFCHAKQARVEVGMKILWLSKVDGIYCCDLVFVVGEILPIQEACRRYGSKDAVLEEWHFRKGLAAHCVKHTFVADMQHSYIPSPAVPLEDEVDALRKRERAEAKPLHIAWSKPSGPLRIEAIDDLEQIVAKKAQQCITGSLPKPSQYVVKPKHPKVQKRFEETH